MSSPRAGAFERRVSAVGTGTSTHLDGDVLIVDTEEIAGLAVRDARIESARVHVVQPGDDVRLVHVLDVVTPVGSPAGNGGGAFPGVLAAGSQVGVGPVVRLGGVYVTVLGAIPVVDSFFTQQEGILDMSGEPAELSPLATEPHVVLELSAGEGVPSEAAAQAYRNASLRAAEFVGMRAAESGSSGPEEPAAPRDKDRDRLRFIHICEVSAFGSLFDTLVVGRSAAKILPTMVSPLAMAEGAVISADYHYAGQRNYTCFYQVNPVEEAVTALGQGEFLGTVILPVGLDDASKQGGAAYAAHLAQLTGADGAVVTAVAGGNAHLDVMFAVRECEKRGIRTALAIVEMAGPTGGDPGMVDTVPEADLMVSTGNREEVYLLPPRERVLGGTHLLPGPEEESGGAVASGSLQVPLRTIVASNNEMGAWRIGARLS